MRCCSCKDENWQTVWQAAAPTSHTHTLAHTHREWDACESVLACGWLLGSNMCEWGTREQERDRQCVCVCVISRDVGCTQIRQQQEQQQLQQPVIEVWPVAIIGYYLQIALCTVCAREGRRVGANEQERMWVWAGRQWGELHMQVQLSNTQAHCNYLYS